MIVYLAALILGAGFPVGIIYLIGLTKFKIEGRADVEKLTSLPVIGDIPLADEKSGSIAVFENLNNLMSETFRNVRTNLQFMLENGKNVIWLLLLSVAKANPLYHPIWRSAFLCWVRKLSLSALIFASPD